MVLAIAVVVVVFLFFFHCKNRKTDIRKCFRLLIDAQRNGGKLLRFSLTINHRKYKSNCVFYSQIVNTEVFVSNSTVILVKDL